MEERVSTKAVFSLVFGILAFNGCPCLGSLLAILLGSGERSSVGRAGFYLGWISMAIYAGVAVVTLVFLLIGGIIGIAQS